MIRHHLPEELLAEYAAGAAPEPLALFVASHLSMSDVCHDSSSDLEAVGGALLASLEPKKFLRMLSIQFCASLTNGQFRNPK